MKRSFKLLAVVCLFGLTTLLVTSCKKEVTITLNKTEINLQIGADETLIATVTPSSKQTVEWSSSADSIATVTNGKVTAKAVGNAIITAKVDSKTATCNVSVTEIKISGTVTIGGLQWATCNVALPNQFAGSPEISGWFYQWNKKVGWSSADPMVNSDGGNTWGAPTQSVTSWETVNNPCPEGFRVPTKTEIQSLVDAGSTWTTFNGVIGRKFGNAPNQIFLPAAGCRGNTNGSLSKGYGDYWSSTSDNPNLAYYMYFDSNSASIYNDASAYAQSIRCVAN